MKLRAYQVTDLEPLLTVWWESWHSSASFRHPKPLAEWRLRWEEIARTHTVVVAETLDTERAVLSQIFVTPGLKRKGIGRALFNWARSRCPNGLTLKTLAENSESRAFYRSLGMTEQGRSINDFNGHEEVEYLLVGAA
jgi:GNAT superfamily N-acetyltransferase